MAEYIDLDTSLEAYRVRGNLLEPISTTLRDFLACNKIPYTVADVAPVRHGRWIQHYEPYDTGEEWIEAPYGFECSECGRWEAEQEPFCNCGASMTDGGET